MPSPRCPECSQAIDLAVDTYYNYNGQVTCPHCGFKSVMAFSNGTLLATKPLIDKRYMIVEPHMIPPQPLGDYEEAISCVSVHAWKAAATMARRAIQGALLEKGVPDAPPRKMIDDARYKHHLLSEREHHLATTVTFFGGKGAHPEDTEINLVGEIEASNGLWVTKTILLALFPRELPPPSDFAPR